LTGVQNAIKAGANVNTPYVNNQTNVTIPALNIGKKHLF
jgi:hypothetical protein